MLDLLVSADFVVPDADATAATFVDRLGVFGHPRWRHAYDGHGYVAHFLRVHRNRAWSPTVLEPQSYGDVPNAADPLFTVYMNSLLDYLGRGRPMLTHSNVQAAGDVLALADRLARRGQPFRLGPLSEDQPYDRLWLGCTPEAPRYDPRVDGGLCLEVVPTAALALPPAAPPAPAELAEGEMVRMTARGWLVRDLDDVLGRLSRNLEFEPAGPVAVLAGQGCRRARMAYAHGGSAALDLIQPTRVDGPAGRALHTLGPGPYYVRIAVNGLAAKADDLASRGVRFAWDRGGDDGGDLLRLDPRDLGGAVFEMVAYRG